MRICIRDRRKELNMSQEELSKRSGISRQTISSIENGACESVLTGTLLSIAKALDTTVDHLFFDESV